MFFCSMLEGEWKQPVCAARESPSVMIKKGGCVVRQFAVVDLIIVCFLILHQRDFVGDFQDGLGVSGELSSGCGAEVL